MKKEIDDALCAEFPVLYSQRKLSPYESCMHWGFPGGDGWNDIIRDISIFIEGINTQLDGAGKISAAQVKEKFGTLRFYLNYEGEVPQEYREQAQSVIRVGTAKTEKTCQGCGQVGTKRSNGWIRVLCDSCDDEYMGLTGKFAPGVQF